MLILHGWVLDTRSYAVMLAASFLALPIECRTDRRAERFGPTLEQGERFSVGLFDCLSHLASLPQVSWFWPEGAARMALSHAVETLEIFSTARTTCLTASRPCKGETHEITHLFRLLEDRLDSIRRTGNKWLSGHACGFEDIILFPMAALARDLGIGMDLYPAIRHYVDHVRKSPGFITMPGIAACH